MAEDKIVIAFDAYGTLLSTESIGKKLAEFVDSETAGKIAQAWRKYQLEYTWRMNSMGVYNDFELVTKRSLQHALLEAKASLTEDNLSEVMHAYDTLSIFPDVAKTMEVLQSRADLYPVVFSNGTQRMVSKSINQSPDLQEYKAVLKDIVVIEKVKRYKPALETYQHLAQHVGKTTNAESMRKLWLVSGNPFDIVGARQAGMNAIWIDRAGHGWQDRILADPDGQPTAIISSLEAVVQTIDRHK